MSAPKEAVANSDGESMWDKIGNIRNRVTAPVNNIEARDVFYGIAAGKLAKLAALWITEPDQTRSYHVIPEVAEIVGFSVGLFASNIATTTPKSDEI